MNITASTAAPRYFAMPTACGAGCACAACAPQPVKSSSLASAATTISSTSAASKNSVNNEQLDLIKSLKSRDREVRSHEQAHLAAAGGLALSAPSFTYQRGPDGVNYAIGGEVRIDVSPGRTPEETLRKAQTIERAALSPRNPSGADRSIAAEARRMGQEAQLALQQQRRAGEDPTASETAPVITLEQLIGSAYRQEAKTAGKISTYA